MLRHIQRLLAAVLFACAAASAFAYNPPPFPRIAGVDVGGPFNYNDPKYQANLAQASMVVLGMYPGLAPGGVSMQSVVEAIKAINPNELIFLYVNENELVQNAGTDAFTPLRDKLNSMRWWLYPSGHSGTPVTSSFASNYWEINNTLFPAKDQNGLSSVDWMTQWFVQEYYKPAQSIDGFFMDNMFWQPRVDGDWNLSGQTQSSNNPTVGTWLRQGYAEYVNQARKLMPGKFQIANIADWGEPQAVWPEYQNLVDGGVLEAMIGESWSVESWGGWNATMAQYQKAMGPVRSPKLVIFNTWGRVTDYQAMRYSLATCLMNNAWFSYTDSGQGYHGVAWFDEFNVNLGQSTTQPPTAPWHNGVWRRDFENGIALVNPKGNGPQTVTLETAFVKINGSQAHNVNNGATVTSVTLQDRDGIILLRQNAVRKPKPPTSVTTKG